MKAPRVSVMVILFNSARYLPACLESLQRQTYQDFEVVMADGGSSDETPRIARKIEARDSRFRYLPSDRLKLISESRQEALAASQGHYVAVLDSDDLAHPTRLSEQVAWMDRHPETVLLATYYRVINGRGWTLRLSPISFTRDIDMRWRLTFGNCLTQSTLMFRRDQALAIGGFDPTIRAGEDMDFYSRLMTKGRLDILPKALSVWRWHGSSLSRTEPADRKSDFVLSVQRAIQREMNETVSEAVAAAVFNQSTRPAESAAVFHEAVMLTLRACAHFSRRLFDPRAEMRLLGRAAFLHMLDLYTKNRPMPWWRDAEPEWRGAVRTLAQNPLRYTWPHDAGLLRYYKKLLKTDWRFLASLRAH